MSKIVRGQLTGPGVVRIRKARDFDRSGEMHD